MLPPHGYQGFSSAPPPAGWVQLGETWVLWWSGRQVACVAASGDGAAVNLDCRKFYQEKIVRAASIGQGKRFAERWCAARIYPGLPLREAVSRLTDNTPIKPPPEPPRLPPTPEQLQQARRNAEAGAAELSKIKDALQPLSPPATAKPKARKSWVRAGHAQI